MHFRHLLFVAFPFLFVASAFPSNSEAVRWWQPYTGKEADGDHVLGLWKFDGEGDGFLEDASSHSHPANLRGAKPNAAGKFGGCMEAGVGFPIVDESHGFHIAKSPVLSPSGAFTVEMWLRPFVAEKFPEEVRPVLIDSKYVPTNHAGFQLLLTKGGSDGGRRLGFHLGMGDRSETWYSTQSILLEPEKWRHLAVTYDARGMVAFFLDGNEIDRVVKPDAGPMAVSKYQLSIGDRLGSNYNGFPGYLDEVRITEGVRGFRPVVLDPDVSRFAFVRMDESAKIRGDFINRTGAELAGAKVRIHLPGGVTEEIAIPDLKASGVHPVEVSVDTALKPGEYTAEFSVDVPGWGGAGAGYSSSSSVPYVVVPRTVPHRMPVVMWGLGGTEGVLEALPDLKSIGFTHSLGLRVDYGKVWDEGAEALPGTPEQVREGREMLNAALEHDLRIVSGLAPARWLRAAKVGESFQRIDRNGDHYGREDVSGVFQAVRDFCFNTGTAMGKAYGDLPAYESALLHTEVRGESQVSFHPEEIEAYRKASGGKEIPTEIKIKNGVEYSKLKEFPGNRVIPDDDPILEYLKWFWKEGDNWNDLNSQLNDGLKQQIEREEFWTFYDPTVRVPSIGGSGGDVDVLSHWTYSYPDPVRIGLCTDELFEMARVSGRGQDVMKMTQIIWYRSQTAPENAVAADSSPWVDQDPGAAYITIAPMHLREAFWWKLARPIKGIMYHGWNSLVESDSPSAYRHTNPNTRRELKRLVKDVVEPLGPALLQIPDAESDVVFLESFTSQMFARRGTYGWNRGWAGDLYHVLMYAQLQPQVLYEERLLDGGLDDAKVLVMGDCDVLTESVVKTIQDFQSAGGLVVGDGQVCPAIRPDHVIERFSRTNEAKNDREKLQSTAKELRKWLDPKYTRKVDSSNPDVMTRRRVYGTTDYIFAVNDRREFGTYVGNWGRVMEDGLPSETEIALKSGHVYELPHGRKVSETGGQVPLRLGPCEGRILMVTERPIRDVALSAPEESERGSKFVVDIAVTDGENPIDAVIPVEVEILDPEGVPSEFSGYYGAVGGELRVTLEPASNDRTGVWSIQVTELASRRTADTYFRLK